MAPFAIRQLGFEELAQAWPVVRTTSRFGSCCGWESSACHLMERGGGVIGVAADDGCFHGVATYEPITIRRAGRVLQVDTMATLELTRSAPVRRTLLQGLAGFARLFDCEAVAVAMPNRGYVEYLANAPGASGARGRTAT